VVAVEARNSRKLCVLVVEDNADTAQSLALLLRLHGYETQIASDGLKALQCVQDGWPDAVLLDLSLPGMDGYQVARRIREHSPTKNKPVLIAITGYGGDEDRRRSLEAGIDQHFIKPTDPMALIESLQRTLNRGE
jgi:CheY-like chemotaxis protein